MSSETESNEQQVRNHHIQVWNTGKRGGGKVPADFGWNTNPKQWQEETGAAEPKPKGPPQL